MGLIAAFFAYSIDSNPHIAPAPKEVRHVKPNGICEGCRNSQLARMPLMEHRKMGKKILEGHLTREELAAELKIKPRTLDAWALRNKGPKRTKLGGRAWYKKNDVVAWIDAQNAGVSA